MIQGDIGNIHFEEPISYAPMDKLPRLQRCSAVEAGAGEIKSRR